MTKNIFGVRVKYKFVDLGPDTDGEYCTIKKEIRINKKLSGKLLKETLLHEEIHAIIDILGFCEIIKEGGVEELLVANISSWINSNYDL